MDTSSRSTDSLVGGSHGLRPPPQQGPLWPPRAARGHEGVKATSGGAAD
jgi:hypothetical protein